jgi:drug/metabolite transporter (DMT)-like permease
VLFFEGLARADSVDAAFIHKTLVVWVAILAVVFLREQTRARHLVAVALLLGGQVVLVGGLPALSWGGGEAMIAVATLLWAIEFVVAKRALADISSHELAAWRMGGGSLLLVAWVLVSGRADTLLAMTPTGWAWVLGTGLLLSAYVGTWYAALARIPAVDVAAVLVAGAIVTALLQAGFDGAAPAPNAVGLGLLGAGALVAARPWAARHDGGPAAAPPVA